MDRRGCVHTHKVKFKKIFTVELLSNESVEEKEFEKGKMHNTC